MVTVRVNFTFLLHECSKMFCILILLVLTIARARVNPDGPTVVQDFTNCLNKMIEINFKEPGPLIFVNTDSFSTSVFKIQTEILHRMHNMMNYAVEVMNPQHEDVNVCDNYDEKLGVLHIDTFNVIPMPAYIVMIIDGYEDFPLLVGRLLRSRSWNPSAKFIILLFNFDSDAINVHFVEKMLTCLFRYNATRIVVIVPAANNIRDAIVYEWKPYDPPKYCGYFNETADSRIYVQNSCTRGSLKSDKQFSHDLPKNMNGCVLDIIALERPPFVSRHSEDSNIEMILVNEIARSYNMTTRYNIMNSNRRGKKEQNGLWDGALQQLTMKKGHVLLGGLFPDNDVHEDFECSSSYLGDSYTWVVPRSFHSPAWIALTIIFKREVWYSVIASFVLSALSWRLLGQLATDSTYNKSLRHNFMNAWVCLMGFSCYIRPFRQSLRVFFSFFNIYCILVLTAYQAKLIDVLKSPHYEYQIQNVEELVESGLQFGGFEELHDLFSNSTDYYDKIIYDQWIVIEDITTAMLDVAVHRNFSVLCSRLELAHFTGTMPELSDHFGSYRYYAYDMNMFSVPVEMVALRGFTFIKIFSDALTLFKQMGLNEALRKRFATFNNLRRAHLLRSILLEKTDVQALSLQHLQAGFLVLALGYISGFVVLVAEIIATKKWVQMKSRLLRNKWF